MYGALFSQQKQQQQQQQQNEQESLSSSSSTLILIYILYTLYILSRKQNKNSYIIFYTKHKNIFKVLKKSF